MKSKFYKTKEEIEGWLNTYGIGNYILIPDINHGYVVNVKGNIDLLGLELDNIPVRFNKISGYFICSNNRLTSLEFCPKEVGGAFYCNRNKLTNLEFCPSSIGHDFYCNNNLLTSLIFSPKEINGDFDCSNNKLINLEFCPEIIHEKFDCSNNEIKNLAFCPSFALSFYGYGNMNLGILQEERDFNKIFQSHIDYIKQIEYEKLSCLLKSDNIKKNKI